MPDAESLGRVSVCVPGCVERGAGRGAGVSLGPGALSPGAGRGSGLGASLGTAMSEKNGVILPES